MQIGNVLVREAAGPKDTNKNKGSRKAGARINLAPAKGGLRPSAQDHYPTRAAFGRTHFTKDSVINQRRLWESFTLYERTIKYK